MIAVIAAATNVAVAKQAAPAASDAGLPFNWFDLAVVALLMFGLFRGRNNGMSREILSVMQWVIILIGCGLGYPIAAQFFVNTLKFDKLTSVLCGYAALAAVVFIIFTILKRLFAERLNKGDSFKGGEYYLGMVGGMVRYACIILVFMAVLNAPVYTQADIDAHNAYVHETYGAGLPGYSGDYFPTLQQVQEQVFAKSFLGPLVKDKLGMILVVGDKPASAQPPPAAPPKPKPKITIG